MSDEQLERVILLRDDATNPLYKREFEYVVVPLEPTSAMIDAACKAMSPGARPTEAWVSARQKHVIRYKAMIAAWRAECAGEDVGGGG